MIKPRGESSPRWAWKEQKMKKMFRSKRHEGNDIVASYKLLEECIDYEHIEDEEYILGNLQIVRDYKPMLPLELQNDIEEFIETIVYPVVFDRNYFSFLNRPEFGDINEEGHFVINSEKSLEMMIFLMYEHTLELHEKLLQKFAKYISQ